MRAISVTRRRWIAGGLAEHVEVTNYSATAQQIELELDLDADAADIFEVRGRIREHRGTYRPIESTPESLVFAYEGLDGLLRRTLVSFTAGRGRRQSIRTWPAGRRAPSRIALDPRRRAGRSGERPLGGLDRPVAAAGPRGARRGDAGAPRAVRRRRRDPAARPRDGPVAGGRGRHRRADGRRGGVRHWTERCARIRSDGELLDLAIRRSIADLRLLRNDGPMRGEHYVAAGIPWFTTLFGRDSIITSLQVLPFMPDVARETLRDPRRLAGDRGRSRTGTWSRARSSTSCASASWPGPGELPHRPYYGSIDATPLWLILLDETYRWTGDLDLVRSLWPNALAALEWIDTYGDRDGDGFVEYERRTPAGPAQPGLEGLGRRDPASRRHASPSRPIALVEIQGYVYDAKRRMASLARSPRRRRRSRRASNDRGRRAAAPLRRRRSGCRTSSFYAIALDRDKRQVGTIGSNAGHCLWSGIVPPERVDAVVDRLLDPSMDCGWGIRTYASGQPGYNPVGYHTGTVWPHDNALIAAGMKRVGPARRRRSRRVADLRGRPALARLPAAGALLRLRPRARRHAGPLPRRVLAPGVVGRDARCRSSRRCSGCTPTRRTTSSSSIGRTCPRGSARSRCTSCGSASAPWTSCSTAGAATRRAPRSCVATARWSS